MQTNTTEAALKFQAERLAAAVIAGMMMEARYHGTYATAAEILAVAEADPQGETACYMRRSAYDAVAMLRTFQREPALLEVFGGAA